MLDSSGAMPMTCHQAQERKTHRLAVAFHHALRNQLANVGDYRLTFRLYPCLRPRRCRAAGTNLQSPHVAVEPMRWTERATSADAAGGLMVFSTL